MKILPVDVDGLGKIKKIRKEINREDGKKKKKKEKKSDSAQLNKASSSIKDSKINKILKKLKGLDALRTVKNVRVEKNGKKVKVEKVPKAVRIQEARKKGRNIKNGTSGRLHFTEEEDEEEEEGEDEDPLRAKEKDIQNKALLMKKRKEIMIKIDKSGGNNNEWLEKLDLTCSDNFYLKKMKLFGNCEERENEFLKFAHVNVVEGLKKLQNLHIAFNRPYDFLADMIKSDIHMERVRQKLLKDHERVEEREKNKIKRLNKKFNKKSGSSKVINQMEAIERKKNIQKIDQLKKEKKLNTLNVQDFFLKHSKSDEVSASHRGRTKKYNADRSTRKQGESNVSGKEQMNRRGKEKMDNNHTDKTINGKSNRNAKRHKNNIRFKTKKRISKSKNKRRKNFKRR
ncbi:rRNA-processing protein EBP2 [Plasmodium gonderi]|uniref:rRNA-processing protein EBP2 n=1 Tax=Plasmodium gonderi TaxID=77519 RepID=A0A1Y1JHR3_PLAGO|nr:rRNA-processing protein EBP2 [Plasmodium gonderi]GAW79983.1 rRNA-processing protein EBP2 [Plasmodium gonderi]